MMDKRFMMLDRRNACKIPFRCVLCLFAVFYFSQVRAQDDYYWYYYVVDGTSPAGASSSLSYGNDGLPRIAYRGARPRNREVKIAEFDGIKWTNITIDPSGQGHVAMTLDSLNFPHVIYHVDDGMSLKYAGYNGSWSYKMIDTGLLANRYYGIDIELDNKNRFHMIYSKHTSTPIEYERMTYAYMDGDGLVSNIIIDDSFSGKYVSLELDNQQRPTTVYYNFAGDLALSYLDENQWKKEIIDSTGWASDQGYYPSMCIDREGKIYVAFQNHSTRKLRFATGRSGQWNVEDVEELPGWTQYSTQNPMILMNDSIPYIAFQDAKNGDLKLTHKIDGEWLTEIVDSSGYVGEWSSMALTPEGFPAISYYDSTNGVLKIAIAQSVAPIDSDNDMIPDYVENIYGTNPGDADSDDDGLSDGEEDRNQNGIVEEDETAPRVWDTDGDGLSDGLELGRTRGLPYLGDILGTDMNIFSPDLDSTTVTNPLVFDTDSDGLSDGAEDVNKNGFSDVTESDPLIPDTDKDGFADGIEVAVGTSPLDIDSDDDGLADNVEDSNLNAVVDENETNPAKRDTDNDGVADGVELGLVHFLDDPDGMGKLLGTDLSLFIPDADPSTTTDPLIADTDEDGALDGQEDVNGNGKVDAEESDPLNPDTDADGLSDGIELSSKSSSLDWDSDDDGIADPDEDKNRNGKLDADETSPSLFDTDHDGLSDGLEISLVEGIPDPDGNGMLRGTDVKVFIADNDPETSTDPRNEDSDEDGLLDGEEDINKNGKQDGNETDPLNWDSDGDTVSDGEEITLGTDPMDPGSVSYADVIFEDTFSDASLQNWTIVDNGTIEGPSDWLVFDNMLVQLSNIFGGIAPDDPNDLSMLGTYIWTGDKLWQNCIIDFKMMSNDDDALGFMFRYNDDKTYYRFSICKELKKAWCMRCLDGSYDVLAEKDITFDLGIWYKCHIAIIDSLLQFSINGELVLKVTDHAIPNGAFAFYTWKNAGAAFSDLRIRGDKTSTAVLESDYIAAADFSMPNDKYILNVELEKTKELSRIKLEGKTSDCLFDIIDEQKMIHESNEENHRFEFIDSRPWTHESYRLTLYGLTGKELQIKDLIPDVKLATDFALQPAYPNPFETQLHFVLKAGQQAFVRYRVFNILGQVVFSAPVKPIGAGWHTFGWNGCDAQNTPAANGIYIILFEIVDDEHSNQTLKKFQQKVVLKR